MVFVSIFLSLIPAILCGYYGGFGTGFLIYITSVFTSFIGLKIGTAIKKFMGEIFVASKSYSDFFFKTICIVRSSSNWVFNWFSHPCCYILQ